MGMISKVRKPEGGKGFGSQMAPCGQVSLASLAKMRKELGNGPMRFAPQYKERSINEQINELTVAERVIYESIKMKWETKHPDDPFTEEMYLRFARCSPTEAFNERTAWRVMKKYERKQQYLTARVLEEQILSKTIFPIPHLTTKQGHEVLYINPGRQHSANASNSCGHGNEEHHQWHKDNHNSAVVDNLVYAVNTMMEREQPCSEGIAILANMNDWQVSSFATDHCFQFMSILQQGIKAPCRVQTFLIVNPPRRFAHIWGITKPMFAPAFREKVKIVQEDKLCKYFSDGFQALLPDDGLASGKASTDKMVADFLAYRKAVEAEQGHRERRMSMSSGVRPERRARRMSAVQLTPNDMLMASEALSSRPRQRRMSAVQLPPPDTPTGNDRVPRSPRHRRMSLCNVLRPGSHSAMQPLLANDMPTANHGVPKSPRHRRMSLSNALHPGSQRSQRSCDEPQHCEDVKSKRTSRPRRMSLSQGLSLGDLRPDHQSRHMSDIQGPPRQLLCGGASVTSGPGRLARQNSSTSFSTLSTMETSETP